VTALALAVLGASLLGSVHCAAMCGGFLAVVAGDPGGRSHPVIPGLAYSGGRLIAYGALGLVAGALGTIVDVAGAMSGVERVAGIIAGALIVLWGSLTLTELAGVRIAVLRAPRALARLLALGLRVIAPWPAPARGFVLGLCAACLPCGWLYAFVITAAGAGSPVRGLGVMLVFWLGTLPVMSVLGAGLGILAAPLRKKLPAACAIAMIVIGLVALGARLWPHATSGARAAGTAARGHVHGHASQ
jgi:uncharacterized protein